MTTPGMGTKPRDRSREQKDSQLTEQVVIEHQDGRLEVLDNCARARGLLIHEETRQAFPEREEVARYTLSLDGDYAELAGSVDYYDDELTNPADDPSFVFGATVAACEAAENGELEEPESLKSHAKLQLIAAVGGVTFILGTLLVSGAIYGGIPWLGG